LYIEDDKQDARLVERYVQITPHQIEIVGTVADAQKAMKQNPDLVMADMLLETGREGYGLVQWIRQHGYTNPIVAVTGLATPFDLQQCYDAGVNEVLIKPFTIDQLAEVITKYAPAMN